MTLREFNDHEGATWTVWEVAPAAGADHMRSVPDALRTGWLAFQCGSERRRLAPIPQGWRDLRREELCSLLARATVTGAAATE